MLRAIFIVLTLSCCARASEWDYRQTLSASDSHAFDNFGTAIDVDGDVAVVGAQGDGWNGLYTGSVHVYRRAGSQWTLEATLRLKHGEAGDQFGRAVAVDGNRIVVSAVGDDDRRGAVYVFEYAGGEWTPADRLIERPRFRVPGDFFGVELALEGDTLAVASPYDTDTPAVHVFAFDGEWSRDDVLVSPAGDPYDGFGWSIVLSDDAELLVGAPGAVFDSSRGAVYVFSFTSRWKHTGTLTPDSPSWYAVGIDVDADGDIAVVGADDGSAYVFERAPGPWTQTAELLSEGGYTRFGNAVSASGYTVLVGASAEGDAGAAHVFARRFGGWMHTDVLTSPDGQPMDFFGIEVALGGCSAFVGNFPDRDDAPGGSAYVFSAARCAKGTETE